MSERSLSVNPVIEPCAGAVIGLGLGYSLAPRKYSLKRLILLNNDTFEKIYSKDLVNNMTLRERNSLESLKMARMAYRESRKSNFEEIKTAAIDWTKKFRNVKVSESLQTAHKTNRANLQKAIVATNYIELNKAYRAAKTAVKNSPENPQLQAALNRANVNLAHAKAIIGSKIELYKNSLINISNERLAKVKNEPVKYVDVREAYRKFLNALAKRRTAVSNKLFELSNDKSLLRNYDALKDYLPRARSASAIKGSVIVGAITTLMMASLTRSVRQSA